MFEDCASAADACDGVAPDGEGQGHAAADEGLGGATENGEEAEPDSAESVEAAKQKELDNGKDAYNKGNYAEAVKAWSCSLKSVKYIIDKGLYKDKPDQMQEVFDMEMKLNANMAQCCLKTQEWGNAVTYADKALARDGSNAKALYRKASALMQLLSFKEAALVLERLFEVEPENAAAQAMLAEARRTAAVGERRAKKMGQRMFAAMARERDPRVPLTEREKWTEWLRTAPAEAIELVRNLPHRCRRLILQWISAFQKRWRQLARPLRQKLGALGLFKAQRGASARGGGANKLD